MLTKASASNFWKCSNGFISPPLKALPIFSANAVNESAKNPDIELLMP